MVLTVSGLNIYIGNKLPGGINYDTGIEGIESQLSVKINSVKALKEEVESLDRQMAYTERIMNSEICSRIIYGFVNLMNRETWLEGFEITKGINKYYEVIMSGYSVGSESLGDFIEKLTEEQMFDSVHLRYAKDAGSEGNVFKGGRGMVVFEIEFKARG